MTRAKLKPKHIICSFTSSLSLSAESGLTYTQSEMGVDGESGWRVVMTSQAVGRLPALSRPARGEPTDTRQQQRGQNSDGCSNTGQMEQGWRWAEFLLTGVTALPFDQTTQTMFSGSDSGSDGVSPSHSCCH